MFRNMVTSLLKYDRIRTTEAKAKELRRWADHIITLAKRGDLHALRQALSIVREKDVVYKIFENAKDRFSNTPGGYTRLYKVGRRPGDTAPMILVELVNPDTNKTPASPKTAGADTAKKEEIITVPSPQAPVVPESASAPAMAAEPQEAGPAEIPESTSTDTSEKEAEKQDE